MRPVGHDPQTCGMEQLGLFIILGWLANGWHSPCPMSTLAHTSLILWSNAHNSKGVKFGDSSCKDPTPYLKVNWLDGIKI